MRALYLPPRENRATGGGWTGWPVGCRLDLQLGSSSGSVGIHREFGKDQRRSMCRQEEEGEEEGINTDRFPPRLKHRKDEDAGRWEIWW